MSYPSKFKYEIMIDSSNENQDDFLLADEVEF